MGDYMKMKIILVMGLAVLSFAGCADVPEYHYSDDINMEDVGELTDYDEESLVETVEIQKDTNFCIPSVENTFVVQDDELVVLYGGSVYTKSEFFVKTNKHGYGCMRVEFEFSGDETYAVNYECTDFNVQRALSIPCVDGTITGITVSCEPWSVDAGEVHRVDDEETEVTFLSTNSLVAGTTGIMECYDKYSNVIDCIRIEKGSSYVVRDGVTCYVIYKELT